MAKRIYKAKDKLVQRRVRGAMVEENVRTKKRRRVGKKDVELDVNMARGPDDGITPFWRKESPRSAGQKPSSGMPAGMTATMKWNRVPAGKVGASRTSW